MDQREINEEAYEYISDHQFHSLEFSEDNFILNA